MICPRENPIPTSDLFECEINLLQLVDYKPILSKGYQFILHIHTISEEAIIKDIMLSYEKNERGD